MSKVMMKQAQNSMPKWKRVNRDSAMKSLMLIVVIVLFLVDGLMASFARCARLRR